jgi:hypothetical protein
LKNLADLVFEYVWMLEDSSEEQMNPDYAMSQMESAWDIINNSFTAEERMAFIDAAKRARDYLLAGPDENGFTKRSLVTEDQKAFLDSICSGDFH